MLSVIVPTMWRHEPFYKQLYDLVEIQCIGEIIIINNDAEKTPDIDIFNHKKIRLINMEKNIYVFPAWNLGAKLAQFDKLAFYSDDLDLDLRAFEKADAFLNPSIGMIGLLIDDVNDHCYFEHLTDGSIEIKIATDSSIPNSPRPVGIGTLCFVNKEDYKEIPKIKIFHGECLLWNRLAEMKRNYMITNCRVETSWHVTVNSVAVLENDTFSKIQEEDQEYAFGTNRVEY